MLFLALFALPLATGAVTVDLKQQTFEFHKLVPVADYSTLNGKK